MKTQKERSEERRREKLAAMQEQIEQGTLKVRKMTPEERAALPPRPAAPKRRSEVSAGPAAVPADVQPVQNETRDRIITGLVTVVPFIALGVAGWQVWADLLGWSDVVVFGDHVRR